MSTEAASQFNRGLQSTEAVPSLGSYQLTILDTCCKALTATVSDLSPPMDLPAQFPMQEAIVQEGTARSTNISKVWYILRGC